MTKKLVRITTILSVLTFALMAADVTGKWTYEQAGRNGGASTTATLTLKSEGSTLTGKVSGGRGGDVDISDGKIDGNNISFAVKRQIQGADFVITYKGTLDGDNMNLEITRPGMGGGDPVTTKVVAKRSAT
jgi:hypothetical protein